MLNRREFLAALAAAIAVPLDAVLSAPTITWWQPDGLDQWRFLHLAGDATIVPWRHDVREVAVWSRRLTDAEIQALHNGISPTLVAPAALQLYVPLHYIRDPVHVDQLAAVGVAAEPAPTGPCTRCSRRMAYRSSFNRLTAAEQ